MDAINIPMEYLIITGIVILVLTALSIFFGMYWMDMRSKCPELDVFLKARQKPRPPVIDLIDLSGRQMFFNATKDKPNDVKLKNDDYGLKIDPRIASKMPNSRLEDGTSMLFYGVNMHFPTDPNGARGIVQIVKKIREEYPQLNFIRDDVVIIELLTKSGGDLVKDAEKVIAMFPFEADQSDFDNLPMKEKIKAIKDGRNITPINTEPPTAEDLAAIFEEIKGNLKNWKVESGYFSMQDALRLLPIGTTSSDMQRVESITKIKTQNEFNKPLEWWQQLAGPFFYAIAGMVVAYLVINAVG